ncbi:lymphocyte antigen 6 complex locus protein G6f isoform X2 [Piliocolobus tephrosceles]|nr:lymphocyte antigen 6 complex locus protein G6f isoform X2 [Piliocolobus tephrosceles]
MELPCPSPPTLHGDEHLSWFRSPAAGSFTTLVAQVQVGRPAPDPGKPGRESRLRLLGNYSLWLEGSKEEDAGRYWCAVLGQHHNYQNWRVYDVLVLKGSQLSARAADGSPCNVLLCSVVPSRRMDSVTWQEGKGPVRGRVQSFWGSEAALLLVCPGEGLSEHKSRRPRIIRCLMTHNKGVSFSLAASMDASPALCAPSMGWDMPWILMLLLTIGQGVIILALSIVLWRQRVCGAPGRGNRMRCYNCGGSPSSSCKEAVTTCGEGRPQPGLEQIKLPGNPPVTLIHQHPACVTAHHCNQVETESVGDVTYPAHRDCYLGDLCNSAVASHVVPACILAAAATALTCLLPGLWSG